MKTITRARQGSIPGKFTMLQLADVVFSIDGRKFINAVATAAHGVANMHAYKNMYEAIGLKIGRVLLILVNTIENMYKQPECWQAFYFKRWIAGR